MRYVVSALMLVVCAPWATLHAQSATAALDEPALSAVDPAIVERLLEPRGADELARELESSRRREADAVATLERYRELAPLVAAQIEVKRRELATLKQRARLAKKSRALDSQAAIDGLRERETLALAVLEDVDTAVGAQISRSEAARELSRRQIEVQEIEMRINDMLSTQLELAKSPTPDLLRIETLGAQIDQASRDALAALRRSSAAGERLARTTERLAEAKLELLESWTRYPGRRTPGTR
jgi:hypothetical protein